MKTISLLTLPIVASCVFILGFEKTIPKNEYKAKHFFEQEFEKLDPVKITKNDGRFLFDRRGRKIGWWGVDYEPKLRR